jgi:multidrug efflux pump subunit AcrA (membrane-fusion protein)
MLVVALAALGTTGCGKEPAEDREAAVATAPRQESAAADANREAELAAREQALAAKEADLARAQQEKEAELARAREKAELARARQEAELAKREAALAREAAAAAAAKSAAAEESPDSASVALASTERLQAAAQSEPVAQPTPITVPAGTRLSVSLAADLSTKTAKVGDAVHARLSSDVIVGGRTAVASGTAVHGTVVQVVSGSHKIGGVPTLGLAFDSIDLGNGKTVSITGHLVQQGESDTAKDTGKILGGAALGAIIGHQMDDGKGKVIGGVLGGAAGAAAAHKTGGEVTMSAGSVLVFATEAPFEVSGG